MYRKYLAPALALVVFTAPAFAATEWYVAKNPTTKKCEVTEHKPDGKKMVMVGTNMFKTKALAEGALKGSADCK